GVQRGAGRGQGPPGAVQTDGGGLGCYERPGWRLAARRASAMITRIQLGHTHLSRSGEPGPPNDPPQPSPQPPPGWRRWLIPIGSIILILLLLWPALLRIIPTAPYT